MVDSPSSTAVPRSLSSPVTTLPYLHRCFAGRLRGVLRQLDLERYLVSRVPTLTHQRPGDACRAKKITIKGALLRNSDVQVCSDNWSVVYYINKKGSTGSPLLIDALSQVIRLAERLQITGRVSYIRSDLNVIADMLSRA